MTDPDITWRRTFPECERGTDGFAMPHHRPGARPGGAPARPEALDVERHRPDPRQRAGAHTRRSALTPTSHGPPDRVLAGAAPAEADLGAARRRRRRRRAGRPS